MNTRQAVGGQSQQGDAQLVLTATRGATPDSVARAFFEQVQGQPQRRQINGLAAITGTFTAQNQQGQQLAGAAAFIAYGGLIYETVGLATPQGWQTHQSAVTAAIQSFGPLTDAAVLNVQPNRLDVVRLDRDVNVREFAQRYTGPVPFAELAVLNNVDSTSTLPRGSIAKRIVGTFTN
jgi:predicted Zn-dependent protease